MSRRGLGRGLGALIPTAPLPPAEDPAAGQVNGHHDPQADIAHFGASAGAHGESNAHAAGPAAAQVAVYFTEIPLDQIAPNPRQPRQVFDVDEMHELVHSIQQIGLLQPVVVRPLPGDGQQSRFELVVGERRWRAAQQAGTGTIPAIVRQTDDDDLLRNALLENLHRSQLNPLEEAAAYDQLLQDFGCTHDELAGRIGRSRPQISNTLRLLKLPPPVQRRVAAGVLSAGHARALLGLDDAAAQDRLAQRIVAEGLSVRAVEEIVAVGEDAAKRPIRSRTSRPTAPGLQDVAGRLSDRLETRVRVELGRSKGKLTIEFGSLDDLHRIVETIDPQSVGMAVETEVVE
ncbi:MAG: ParB/RepB/Spo0J family partition protein [Candidatus Nanopelagicales bacterium]